MLDEGEIGGAMVDAYTAVIVTEDHIQDPMEAVFHRPTGSDGRPELVGQPHQRGEVKAGLPLDLVSDLPGFWARSSIRIWKPRR